MTARGKTIEDIRKREETIQRVMSSKLVKDGGRFSPAQIKVYTHYKNVNHVRAFLRQLTDAGLLEAVKVKNKVAYQKAATGANYLTMPWRTHDNSFTGLKPYYRLGAVV